MKTNGKTTKANTNVPNSVAILINKQNYKQRVITSGIHNIYKWKLQNYPTIEYHTHTRSTCVFIMSTELN